MSKRIHPSDKSFNESEYNRLLAAFEREGRPQVLTIGNWVWRRYEDNGRIYFVGEGSAGRVDEQGSLKA